MTESIEIQMTGRINATIRPPGSKSITNRALVCAALAKGPSVLTSALDSDDTQVMIQSLRKLGIDCTLTSVEQTIRMNGCGGRIPVNIASLFVGNSGTTIRFLTALVSIGHGNYHLDGVARMRERPIGDLLQSLQQLQVDAHSDHGDDCPPVTVRADGLVGGRAIVRGDISSQFLSGLMLIAPYSRLGVELRLEGPLVSKPYVDMTRAVMEAFGVSIRANDYRRFQIPSANYIGRSYDIEPDASAASYFWGAAAVTGGTVTVSGLNKHSLQGDVAFCECLKQMGCEVVYRPDSISVSGRRLRGIDVNMNAISDTVQTLCAVALFADGPTTISGVAHIRHKETDRIADLARELRKLGAEVRELVDGLQIVPKPLRPASIVTYADHRMAMSLALVGLRQPGIRIEDPGCTAKTYPNFFADLTRISRSRS
jgi:3-phosphoshikimate 1-carboxyvinyltransferase